MAQPVEEKIILAVKPPKKSNRRGRRNRRSPPPPRPPRSRRNASGRNNRNRRNTNNGRRVARTRNVPFNLRQIIAPDLGRYIESVIHPFGDGGIGAFAPNRWSSNRCIPVTDRISFTLDPTLYTTIDAGVQPAGFFVALVPRSIQAGWMTTRQGNAYNEFGWYGPKFTGLKNNDSDEIITATNTDIDQSIVLNHYYLLVSLIDADGDFRYIIPEYTDTSSVTQAATVQTGGYNAIAFTRFSRYKDNCDNGCLLGAGIKIRANKSLLNTGGKVYGGSITHRDAITIKDVGTNAAKVIQNKLKEWRLEQGVEGITVRYEPSQDSLQQREVIPKIPNDQVEYYQDAPQATPVLTKEVKDVAKMIYNQKHGIVYSGEEKKQEMPPPQPDKIQPLPWEYFKTNGKEVKGINSRAAQALGANADQPDFYPMFTGNVDPSSQDQMSGGSSIPGAVWKYNLDDNEGVYTLAVQAVVHVEGVPDGNCPFGTYEVHHDPMFQYAKSLTENKNMFPVVTEGNSFKSFWTKATEIVGKAAHNAGKIAKMLVLLEKFGGDVGGMIG